MPRLLDDVKLVTCAGPCGMAMIPPSEVEFANALNARARGHLPEKVMAKRINGRPFCAECSRVIEHQRGR